MSAPKEPNRRPSTRQRALSFGLWGALAGGLIGLLVGGLIAFLALHDVPDNPTDRLNNLVKLWDLFVAIVGTMIAAGLGAIAGAAGGAVVGVLVKTRRAGPGDEGHEAR